MRNDNPYSAYQHAAETLSHLDQIILLYGLAISYVQQADEAIKNRDFETRYNLINKTCAIINSLRAGLDFSVAREVAEALEDHYQTMDDLLISIQVTNSRETCRQVVENLKVIRTSWEGIADRLQEKQLEKHKPANDEADGFDSIA